jgi:hypothetical protein
MTVGRLLSARLGLGRAPHGGTLYERQRPVVQGDAEGEAAFTRGLTRLAAIFKDCLVENVVDRVRASDWERALRSGAMLLRESATRFAAALRLACI